MVVVAYAATDRQLYDDWKNHQAKYGRKYHSSEHAREAFANFAREHQKVRAHNARFRAGLETYEATLTQFSDMSEAERASSTGLNYRPDEMIVSKRSLNATCRYRSGNGFIYMQAVADANLPASVDHSKFAGVIRDQGQCGSCYSFAGTKVIEMILAKDYAMSYTLSPQQLVDCSTPFGNNGCSGGFPSNVFDYYIKYGVDLVQESQYPYKAAVQAKTADQCLALAKSSTVKANVTNYVIAKQYDKQAVKTVLAKGPAFGAIFVSPSSPLYTYKSGIISDPTPGNPNHAIVIVGYATINGTGVFKILNSWGSGWGMGGFAYIKDTDIQITSNVFYPNVTRTA